MPPMTGPTPQERYHLVAPLPPLGGWRRMLAIDRRGSQTGPVVLSFAPVTLIEDTARLAALSRDAEAGARVHHPNVLPVLGLEAVDDQLALAEPYRAGTALRLLLDASGRLPVELAVRVLCDVATGLAALHALDPGDGQPLAHGALTADRILVAEDGTSLVSGVGTGGGRSAADDVRALAAVAAELLTGEAPLAGRLDVPGVPAAVAAVIDRARGIAGEPLTGAAAFAAALAGAFPPATASAVAVYVGAVTPPPGVVPAAVPPRPPPVPEVLEVSAELIAPGRFGAGEATPEPTAERTPPPDAAITFPAPPRPTQARRLPRATLLLALVVVGLTIGFGIGRAALGQRAPAPVVDAKPAPDAKPAVDTTPAAPSAPPAAEPRGPLAEAKAPPAEPATPPPVPAPAPAAPAPRKPPSIAVTAVPAGEILVDGKPAGRAPCLVEVSAGEHEVRLRDRAQGVDARRRVTVKAPATPVRFALARGKLEVTAPDDTEVWVDGRRVGKGSQTVDLWEGWHEVEGRRGAAGRVKERFELTALVTKYTYAITPIE
jgi:hypothetical protein